MVSALRTSMARPARTRTMGDVAPAVVSKVKIEEECLELEPASWREIDVLRRWLHCVNGPAYPQPYLVERPPGRFRLYVGAAAERVRTSHGMR